MKIVALSNVYILSIHVKIFSLAVAGQKSKIWTLILHVKNKRNDGKWSEEYHEKWIKFGKRLDFVSDYVFDTKMNSL